MGAAGRRCAKAELPIERIGRENTAIVDADVFVLPSRYGTFPVTILEAYACAKPVVASNVGGILDLVLHGKTCLLFQAEDAKELSRSIIYVLTHPREADKMRNEAFKLVKEKFFS
ncbi:glycosyltransferase [Infirmifilum sp.]|uniref:glycosyltransferase n=1 Tax=Infirmifilum sp. TaxID=2856575 RepID=UPI003D0F87F9